MQTSKAKVYPLHELIIKPPESAVKRFF